MLGKSQSNNLCLATRQTFRNKLLATAPRWKQDIDGSNPRTNVRSIGLCTSKNWRFLEFRYWALNTKLRHQSARSSHWMWKKSSDKDITFDELKELLDNPDLRLSEIIARRVSNLRGTRPYWIDKSKQLDAIIRSRPLPAIFCTLSTADHHWPDLFEHMPAKDDCFNAAAENQRMQIARQQVQENAHIINEYLTMRFQTFYEELFEAEV